MTSHNSAASSAIPMRRRVRATTPQLVARRCCPCGRPWETWRYCDYRCQVFAADLRRRLTAERALALATIELDND